MIMYAMSNAYQNILIKDLKKQESDDVNTLSRIDMETKDDSLQLESLMLHVKELEEIQTENQITISILNSRKIELDYVMATTKFTLTFLAKEFSRMESQAVAEVSLLERLETQIRFLNGNCKNVHENHLIHIKDLGKRFPDLMKGINVTNSEMDEMEEIAMEFLTKFSEDREKADDIQEELTMLLDKQERNDAKLAELKEKLKNSGPLCAEKAQELQDSLKIKKQKLFKLEYKTVPNEELIERYRQKTRNIEKQAEDLDISNKEYVANLQMKILTLERKDNKELIWELKQELERLKMQVDAKVEMKNPQTALEYLETQMKEKGISEQEKNETEKQLKVVEKNNFRSNGKLDAQKLWYNDRNDVISIRDQFICKQNTKDAYGDLLVNIEEYNKEKIQSYCIIDEKEKKMEDLQKEIKKLYTHEEDGNDRLDKEKIRLKNLKKQYDQFKKDYDVKTNQLDEKMKAAVIVKMKDPEENMEKAMQTITSVEIAKEKINSENKLWKTRIQGARGRVQAIEREENSDPENIAEKMKEFEQISKDVEELKEAQKEKALDCKIKELKVKLHTDQKDSDCKPNNILQMKDKLKRLEQKQVHKTDKLYAGPLGNAHKSMDKIENLRLQLEYVNSQVKVAAKLREENGANFDHDFDKFTATFIREDAGAEQERIGNEVEWQIQKLRKPFFDKKNVINSDDIYSDDYKKNDLVTAIEEVDGLINNQKQYLKKIYNYLAKEQKKFKDTKNSKEKEWSSPIERTRDVYDPNDGLDVGESIDTEVLTKYESKINDLQNFITKKTIDDDISVNSDDVRQAKGKLKDIGITLAIVDTQLEMLDEYEDKISDLHGYVANSNRSPEVEKRTIETLKFIENNLENMKKTKIDDVSVDNDNIRLAKRKKKKRRKNIGKTFDTQWEITNENEDKISTLLLETVYSETSTGSSGEGKQKGH